MREYGLKEVTKHEDKCKRCSRINNANNPMINYCLVFCNSAEESHHVVLGGSGAEDSEKSPAVPAPVQ